MVLIMYATLPLTMLGAFGIMILIHFIFDPDPNKTYEPWPGLDANGNPYADMSITAASVDPSDPSAEVINLLNQSTVLTTSCSHSSCTPTRNNNPGSFRYYTWSDNDNDGLFDDGEETEVIITAGLSDTIKQNFANWFSYHRKTPIRRQIRLWKSNFFCFKRAYGNSHTA